MRGNAFQRVLQLLKAPWPVQKKVAQDKAGPTRSDDAERAGHRGLSGVLILHDGTLFSRCVIHNCFRSHYYVILSLLTRLLTSIPLVTIEMIVITMESYHDAANPWLPPVIRIDRPPRRDGHCAEPHLVGCRAHARLRELALRDCWRAIGGAHRLAVSRPVSRRGKYVFSKHRERGADHIVRFADSACCRRHCLVGVG